MLPNRQVNYLGGDSFELEVGLLDEELAPSEALVRVLYCGICGSDMGFTATTPKVAEPMVLGHEMVGQVMSVGSASDRVGVGDFVVANPGIPCGRCGYCRSGKPNLCPHSIFAGFGAAGGFLQDYVKYPVDHLYPVRLSQLIRGVLVEPLAVGLHALSLGRPRIGQSAFVAGGGGIGACLVLLLKQSGIHPLVVAEPRADRREVALKLGADLVVDPSGKNAEKIATEMLDAGIGPVDLYFEAAGARSSLGNATTLTAAGGKVIVVGIAEDDALFLSHSEARKKALTIKMSRTIRNTIPEAVGVVEREEKPDLLLGDVVSLEQFPESFARFRSGGATSCRAVVRIGG
jgi:L-iditol 2-dehydrogenase